ncbi:TetR/AcrR family transcriptional regulator [Methylogaea oryzae]|uniref:TetR/AcrR family transcriptional regulator n=1 Tax=Methylogaea oryzae TaxID=1295382 RepID=UPI000AA5351B|nr:TetR family transcriptional regulator [Methylogaea oryzae]
MTEDSLTDPTRDRLLRAAGQVFAEKGFREATVREICRHAEVNVAAVNYHFRGKEALYGEALAYAYREADARYPLALAEGSAEERLRHYIGNFLRRLLDQSQLLARPPDRTGNHRTDRGHRRLRRHHADSPRHPAARHRRRTLGAGHRSKHQ